MKKPKINLSKQGIQDFFFRHSEKLFFGLAVCLIALFFWLGFKTPRYQDTTPSAMLQTSQRANEFIHDGGSWDKIAQYRTPITDAADRIRTATPIDSTRYPTRQMLGTVVRTLEKRTDPLLLKPGDIVTRYFRAQVALQNKDGDSQPKRATALSRLPKSILSYPSNQKGESFIYRIDNPNNSFVTVDAVVGMALIDYESQLEAYRETFQYQRGYDPDRDEPEFAFVEVQRKTDDPESEWVPITGKLAGYYDRMGAPCKDIIPPDLAIDFVTMPVPPFLGLDYREFSVLPEMKSISIEEFTKILEENQKDGEESEDDSDMEGADYLSGSSADDSKDVPPDQKNKNDDESDDDEVVQYRLVRFYDLDNKAPGQNYLYRIRLWFVDPNNPDNFDAARIAVDTGGPERASGGGQMGTEGGGKDDGDGDNQRKKKEKKPLLRDDLSPDVKTRLANEPLVVEGLPKEIESRKDVFMRLVLPGEWVETTQPVAATTGFETFVAGPVAAPTPTEVGDIVFFKSEPAVTVVVNSFQDELGVFVPAKTTAGPGSLLNFRSVTNLLHPVTWEILELYESVDRREKKIGRKFESEAVIVDALGGERQPFANRKDAFRVPSEVLIMDRNGKLILRNELNDETSYRHAIFQSQANKKAIEQANKKDDDDDDDNDGGVD